MNFAPDVLDPPAVQVAVEDALKQRPEVVAQATRVRATELTYSSITGERLPSLVAQGDYGLIGNRWNNTLDTYNMALLLQVPIFDGGQREGRIAESRSQLTAGSASSSIHLEPCENGSARCHGRLDCRKEPSEHRAGRYAVGLEGTGAGTGALHRDYSLKSFRADQWVNRCGSSS